MNPNPGRTGRPHLNLTAEERNTAWDHATRAAADAIDFLAVASDQP